MPFAAQQLLQRPGFRERVLQVQLVDAPLEQLGLARDRNLVRRVDHFFALSMPAFLSAPSKKSFSSASWNCSASSDRVLSPRIAASATFALNSAP
jgi:hypothetical protein